MLHATWREPALGSTTIDRGYWAARRAVNRDRAILYQWDRYEDSGTIDNFRIAAGLKAGERRGFFYADSDLHKWADAAGRILRSGPSPRLQILLDEYVDLMAQAQEEDGYLFTYNQIHFPGTRWKNLMIEHELYCLGHFIEAGVSLFELSLRRDLLDLALRSADLVVREFRAAPSERSSGHEEIEIALLRLYRITRDQAYLDTARALIERRGRIKFFGLKLIGQFASQTSRSRAIASRSRAIASRSKAATTKGPAAGGLGFEVGGNLGRREPPFVALRSIPVFLGGAYQQQDRRFREQVEPKGHAVRWAYLMTSAAMLYREAGDDSLLETMRKAWVELVEKKMYVTGGMGALPVIEGFGRPYELDNSFSYSETCAAIGSVLWNRELSLSAREGELDTDARHADLIEWQLYNAVAAGISSRGDEYFYRNPLASDGEIARRPWYATPCCPSNISRLWADAENLAFSSANGAFRVEQYISSSTRLEDGTSIRMESGFPWSGDVAVSIETPVQLRLLFRIPGWANLCRIALAGSDIRVIERERVGTFGAARFASASYEMLELPKGSSSIRMEFDMPVSFLRANAKVKCDRGRVAIVRGPLVYCAEAVDNPGLDLDSIIVDPAALRPEPDASFPRGDCIAIVGSAMRQATGRGRRLGGRRGEEHPCSPKLIPYSLWGNRGKGTMRVFLRSAV